MRIRPVESPDVVVWAAMRKRLWPEANTLELHRAAVQFVGDPPTSALAAVFIAEDNHSRAVGFIEIGVRALSDCCESSAVPHIDGWFILENYRRQRMGTWLMRASEFWALSRGFGLLATDAAKQIKGSQLALIRLGFEKVNDRVAKYRKLLDARSHYTGIALSPEASEVLKNRIAAFERCFAEVSTDPIAPTGDSYGEFAAVCPCCGYPTLYQSGMYDICFLCGWEDDGDDAYVTGLADHVSGGPNFDYSLTEGRWNFSTYRTQYRPDDERGFFAREQCTLEIRQQIIALYDSLLPAVTRDGYAATLPRLATLLAQLYAQKFPD